MPVTVKEWAQTQWTRPGVDLFRQTGDFNNLLNLYPHHTGRALRRAPGWSAHIEHAGLTDVRAMFYDHASDRYVLIGTNASDHLASAYYNTSWTLSAITELTSSVDTLGGLSMRNALYHGGKLYLIADTGDIYRSTGYTSGMSKLYNCDDAQLLAAAGGRVYMLNTAGKIYRLNSADDAFQTHFTPITSYHPLYATPYRSYLCIIGNHDNGDISVYRAPYPNIIALHEVARISLASPFQPTYGSLFALHDDAIYFSPGPREEPNRYSIDFYRFDGSRLEFVTQIASTNDTTHTHSLFSWRGKLIYCNLGETLGFQMLVGDHFVTFPSFDQDTELTTPLATSLGTEILVTAKDSDSHEGIYHAGTSTFDDGYLLTSRLDMDHPGIEKKLHRLTVLLDSSAADFDVIIKYRVNDNTTWTTAVTQANTNRVTISGLGISFYTLQIRVDLDDDTAANLDKRIIAVSAVYSIAQIQGQAR